MNHLDELDACILQAEQRLMAREQRLRRGIDAIDSRLRQALPSIGLAAAMSLLGGWWWQRRGASRRRAAPVAGSTDQAAAKADGGGIPWVNLVALGWPLLPAAWRARISPATASTLVAIGLPMVQALLGGRRLPPPATMAAVDLARFAGEWFVLAQLPRHAGATRRLLRYELRADGNIDVCWSSDTEPRAAPVRGVAQVVPGSAGAKLALSWWPSWLQALPAAWTEHWILHVDADYSEALVGTARRDRLFVLSRRPQLSTQRLNALLQVAGERGFAVGRLRF